MRDSHSGRDNRWWSLCRFFGSCVSAWTHLRRARARACTQESDYDRLPVSEITSRLRKFRRKKRVSTASVSK
jgi:hypothetical protein